MRTFSSGAVEQTREILRQDTLSREQVETLARNAKIQAELPTPSGFSDGEPYWCTDSVVEWSRTAKRTRSASDEIQHRAAVADRPHSVVRALRSASWDDSDRSFEAVAASEKRVAILDLRNGVIDEILATEGGEFPERAPLLDSHARGKTDDVVGSMSHFYRDGTLWIGEGRIAAAGDARADAIAAKIRDGHLDSLSIGYAVLEYTDLSPGETRNVAGRSYTAGDRVLRVATAWRVYEVSLVAVPADDSAKIRTSFSLSTRNNNMPAIHSYSSVSTGPTLGALISASLAKRGISDPSRHRVKHDGQEIVRLAPCDAFERDAERGRDLEKLRFTWLLAQAAKLDGLRDAHSVPPTTILAAIHHHFGSRAFSTLTNIGALFSATFGALFLDAYSQPDSTEGWTSATDGLDLREAQRVMMSPVSSLKRRTVGQTADPLDVEAVSEPMQIVEYAGSFAIDEQDIINDTFGALEDHTPRQMGEAARRLRADLAYSTLLSNPVMRDSKALFHADHNNVIASAALDEANLESAMAKMGAQTQNGVPLNLVAEYLIVPQAMGRTAAKLAKEVELLDTSSARAPIMKTDNRISAGVVDPVTGLPVAGDPTAWFLASKPGAHTLEFSYLAGTGRSPKVEISELTDGRFGVQFDIQHYLGCTALDWRGLVKVTN